MTDQPHPVHGGRSYFTLAAAIVVAAVIISAAILATLGSSSAKTVYEVTTRTAQTTTTLTVISTSSATPTTSIVSAETCTPAMTLTQSSSNNSSTTEVITLCHSRSYYTAQPQSTSSPQAFSDRGLIQILNGTGFETFTYAQWNSSTPSTFTIASVTFSLWTNTSVTFSGGSCYGAFGGYGGYVIRFADGSSQTMTTCTVGPNPPIALRLTSHTKPQAGLLIVPSTGAVYFLVSG